MANNAMIPPAGTAGTYTTDKRDDRSETDPSRALTLRELTDLRWRFTEVESDLGIHSTFGVQLEQALAQRISDDAMLDEKRRRALRAKLRSGWKPKRELTVKLIEHLGLSLATRHECGDEYMYMHAPLRPVPSDPYEDDWVLVLVRRMREIDRRRVLIGRSHDRVLEAVYGNSTLGDDAKTFRKRLGDLADVAVAVVNSKREPGDAPARAIVRSKLNDDSFVRMMKHVAGGYLRAACEAYSETRS